LYTSAILLGEGIVDINVGICKCNTFEIFMRKFEFFLHLDTNMSAWPWSNVILYWGPFRFDDRDNVNMEDMNLEMIK